MLGDCGVIFPRDDCPHRIWIEYGFFPTGRADIEMSLG